MNLSTRQLRLICYLAQSLSFSRTSEQFHTTQPTLSRAIKEIEETTGVRLFERTTRSVRITPEGQAVVKIAHGLLQDYESAMSELSDVVRQKTYRLAVAALPTLAARLLPGLVAEFRRRHSDAAIRVHDVVMQEVLDLVRSRRADLALTAMDLQHSDLEYTELFSEPFVLLTRRGAPRAPARWSEAEIQELGVICMPEGTATRQLVDAVFMRAGMQFRPILALRDINAIAGFVRSGFGVALLPRLAAEIVKSSELSIQVMKDAPQRSIGLVTRRETHLPEMARAFIDTARTHVSQLR